MRVQTAERTETETIYKVKDEVAPKPRSLAQLEKLIKEEQAQIFETNIERYRRMGRLLEEARPHFKTDSQWDRWLRKKLDISRATANKWRAAGSERAKYAKTLQEAVGDTRTWRDRAEKIVEQTARDAGFKDADEMRARAKANSEKYHYASPTGIYDRARNKPIAIQIVNAGYRELAKKYHPDSGNGKSSHEMMSRLNNTKAKLLSLIEERL